METPTHEGRDQAEAALAYIRDTMESASTFTALSGWGLVGVGVLGLLAAWLAWAAGDPSYLGIWVPIAFLAFCTEAVASAAKARRLQVPLWSRTLRKMAWGIAPALVAGGMLTLALIQQDVRHIVPGVWLAVYGAGVAASGTFSVGAVRWMGLVVLALGGFALAQPDSGLILLAAGFGATHLGFGFYIARRHGG